MPGQAEVSVLITARDEASAEFRRFNAELRQTSRQMQHVGMVAAGMSAAISVPLILAVRKAAETNATLKGQLDALSTSIDSISVRVGNSLAPAVGMAAEKLSKLLGAVQEASPEMFNLGVYAAAGTAALLGFSGAALLTAGSVLRLVADLRSLGMLGGIGGLLGIGAIGAATAAVTGAAAVALAHAQQTARTATQPSYEMIGLLMEAGHTAEQAWAIEEARAAEVRERIEKNITTESKEQVIVKKAITTEEWATLHLMEQELAMAKSILSAMEERRRLAVSVATYGGYERELALAMVGASPEERARMYAAHQAEVTAAYGGGPRELTPEEKIKYGGPGYTAGAEQGAQSGLTNTFTGNVYLDGQRVGEVIGEALGRQVQQQANVIAKD